MYLQLQHYDEPRKILFSHACFPNLEHQEAWEVSGPDFHKTIVSVKQTNVLRKFPSFKL